MMKTIKLIFSMTVVILALSVSANAQCAEPDVIDGCGNNLNKSFRYLKTYDVDGQAEYSYVFSRGNTYLIQTCEEGSVNKKMKITVLDRTKHKIAANYDRNGNLSNTYLAYRCNSTSIYYVKFEIDEGADEECGVGILGFK